MVHGCVAEQNKATLDQLKAAHGKLFTLIHWHRMNNYTLDYDRQMPTRARATPRED